MDIAIKRNLNHCVTLNLNHYVTRNQFKEVKIKANCKMSINPWTVHILPEYRKSVN